MALDPLLTTARLALRELTLEDLDFVAAMLAHPEVMRHYVRRLDRDEARVWLERQQTRYARDGFGLWLAVERASGEPVGQVGVTIQEVEGERLTEIGYLLHRPFWGRGLATEAARACRDHALGPLGRERVVSLIRPDNHPSRAVALRLEMRTVDVVDFHDREHLLYAVSRAELGLGPERS